MPLSVWLMSAVSSPASSSSAALTSTDFVTVGVDSEIEESQSLGLNVSTVGLVVTSELLGTSIVTVTLPPDGAALSDTL